MPLIVSPPPGSPFLEVLRSREAEVVRLVDVVPTVLDLMALPPLPGQMGRSLLEDAERVQYGEARPRGDKTHTYSFRDERTMLIYRAHDDAFEMYDLVADPGQQIDVFAERGGERADWQALLKEIAAGRLDGASSASEDPEMAGHLEALGYL